MSEESRDLAKEVQTYAQVFGVAPQLSDWLKEIPLLWLPSQTFAAEAVREGDHRFVLLTYGFRSLLRYTAEYHVVMSIQARRQELDNLSDEERSEQEKDHWDLFLKIFSDQLRRPDEAVPLASFLDDAPMTMQVASKILELLPLLFVLLHEIGHFNLGHLRRTWLWWRNTVRTDISSIVQEPTKQKKIQEYEADLFVLRQNLFFGADRFFSFLSLVYMAYGYRSSTHPHPYNRLYRLLNEFRATVSSDRFNDETIRKIRRFHEHSVAYPSDFDGGRLFQKARKAISKNASEQLLAVKLYFDLTRPLLSDIAVRPTDYSDLYFPFLNELSGQENG